MRAFGVEFVEEGIEARLPAFLIAVADLVARLARDAKLPADLRHGFAIEQTGEKNAGVSPSPNSLSTALTPPAGKKRKV
jgi:hypothetical protein